MKNCYMVSNQVAKQRLSFIASTNHKVKQKILNGEKVFKLSGGEPEYVAPEFSAIFSELSKKTTDDIFKYSPIAGFDNLRKLLAKFMLDRYGSKVKEENILVCSGGCSGLFLTIKTLLNPGDKVLIQEPGWEYIPYLIENCNGVSIRLRYFARYSYTRKWHLLLEEIESHLKKNIRLIIINSPLNPTGEIIPTDVFRQIIKMCNHYGVWVVSDDVTIDFNYLNDFYGRDFLSFNNFISVNSFSKNFGISGLRFGFVVGPELFVKHLMKSQLYTFMYPNSLIQKAVMAYLSMGKKIYLTFLEKISSEFKQRARKCVNLLKEIPGINITDIDGGLFVFPCCIRRANLDFDLLLNNHLVAVAPGVGFGSHCKNYFRIFIGTNEADFFNAIQQLKIFLKKEQ